MLQKKPPIFPTKCYMYNSIQFVDVIRQAPIACHDGYTESWM